MLIGFLTLGLAYAQPSDPKEILETAIEKKQFNNSIQILTMSLFAKNGSKTVRSMEIHLRKDDEVLRSYTRFTSPPEIANTQLLFVDHPQQEDPQILYLPALKRIQRISGSKKKGSFMGSDFQYSDLELSLSGNETHALLSEDKKNWTIQSQDPQNKQYKYWITTISKEDYIPYKVQYYAKNGNLLKTLSIEETMNVDNRIIPKTTVMTNHKKGSKTQIQIQEIKVNLSEEALPLERFTVQQMEK
ncbi:MAG: hypothetical protein CL916_05355 [Deltaproteobacteria bacterium]|nr:hypothetical protein [Deltaproteobacteria bacterium]